jgi:hypothetical protein
MRVWASCLESVFDIAFGDYEGDFAGSSIRNRENAYTIARRTITPKAAK